jgi:hypothetical protein
MECHRASSQPFRCERHRFDGLQATPTAATSSTSDTMQGDSAISTATSKASSKAVAVGRGGAGGQGGSVTNNIATDRQAATRASRRHLAIRKRWNYS